MSNQIKIDYFFRFKSGDKREISLLIDENTLALVSKTIITPPFWSELAFHQCSVCPLDARLHSHCPIAAHLSDIVDSFGAYFSYETVTVEVSDSQRRYYKETSLQDGLGSLMGIIMATGGCPVMEPLRPLVRFHLPFASMEETEFRIVSMYLIAQYFREKNGEKPDWSLDGLQVIYDKVGEVNRSFAERLRSATSKDASVNALIVLDCFAKGVPFAVRTTLRDYEKFFESYITNLS
ncbi:MAG: hypothetical protein WC007_06135 [Pelobacteraceae bacterium]